MKHYVSLLLFLLACFICVEGRPQRRWTTGGQQYNKNASVKKRAPFKKSASRPKLAARQASDPGDPCAYLYNQQLATNGTQYFTAQDVYKCLVEIPFYREQASELLNYLRGTFTFQSTLAYLRDPPSSYQQPSIDVFQSLAFIQDQVDTGAYTNQYSFEAAVQRLLSRMHDGHVLLLGGVLEVTSFGSPSTLTAASPDGFALPKIYLTDDLFNSQSAGNTYQPSAVSHINGKNVADYLERYAELNSYGNIDPHADWNDLFDSQVADALGTASYFDVASSFYNGDSITFTFENGTSTPIMNFEGFLDLTSFCTSAITNGADVYNCLVAPPTNDTSTSTTASSAPPATTSVAPTDTGSTGFDATAAPTAVYSYSGAFIYGDIVTPTSAAPSVTTTLVTSTSSAADAATSTSSATSWNDGVDTELPAFPNDPVVIQPNLGVGGFSTGYIICIDGDTKIGVLSIPTFYMADADVATFSNTTAQFIQIAQAEQVDKIVIDLQQNLGGLSLLATDTFRQFFPNTDPFGGSRMRSHRYSDQIGSTLTPFGPSINPSNQTWYQAYLDDPFAVTSFIDVATGQPFQNWPEFFGPHEDHGDQFSTIERNNLNNAAFDGIATSEESDDSNNVGITPYGFANRPASNPSPPFAASDIILLVDGLCSSACSIFTEAMIHEAGVRSVMVGGLPQPGPAQGVAGTRGARPFDSYSLDADMQLSVFLNNSLQSLFPDRSTGIVVDTLLFNLQDQIRRNENFPLQFAYEASDCRIFFSLANVNNYTRLWIDAADASTGVAGGYATCIAESIGYTTSTTDMVGPTQGQKLAWRAGGLLSTNFDSNELAGLSMPGLTGALLDPGSASIVSAFRGQTGLINRNDPRGQFGGGQKQGLGGQQFSSDPNVRREQVIKSLNGDPAKPTNKIKL